MQDLNAIPLPDLYSLLASDGLVDRLLGLARDEDLGPNWEREGDITSRTFVPGHLRGSARLVFRQGGVVAGLAVVERLLHVFKADLDVTWHTTDGSAVGAGAVAAELSGRFRDVLTVERTLLNLVGRLSGIATRTAAFVKAARAGGNAVVLDTRKTSPGLRVLEKYAVRCGGGHCHRLGLFDAVLLKDNHLSSLGSLAGKPMAEAVRAAVRLAHVEAPADGLRFVELEVDSIDQLRAILDAGGCGVGIILLDNMDVPKLREAVRLRDASGVGVLLEASGGVTLESIGPIAATGVDRISAGSLTHGATWLDVALDA